MTDLPPETPEAPTRAGPLRRAAPFIVIVAVLLIAWRTGLTDYLSLDALREHRERLSAFTAEHPVLSLGGYVAAYTLAVVFSLPGALIMTLTGGMLFGTWLGGAAAILSASTGATIVFLIGRSAFGDVLRARAGPVVGKLVDGFEQNAASYLLTLRLIPIVPFFAVNLAAGLVRVRPLTFLLITVFGIMPGSLIYASIGSSLVTVFARGEEPNLSIFTKPHIFGPLLALAALSLLPVAYRYWRGRQVRVAA